MTPMTPRKPWILVWDLDETLVTGWKNGWKPTDITVNSRAAFVMSMALKLRLLGIVKYIFLLTNNSDKSYIYTAIKLLGEHIQFEGKIFDTTLINDPSMRTCFVSKSSYNPDKSLRDVDYLLSNVKCKNTHNAYRILFFDDRGDHVLKTQLPCDHYIQITPPFSTTSTFFDETPWSKVLGLLRSGLHRRTRRQRRRTRKN